MIDYNAMSAAEVADYLADQIPRDGSSTASHDRTYVRRGVRMILGHVEDLPGTSWQEKWFAGDGDEWAVQMMLPPIPAVGHHHRYSWNRSMQFLVAQGILRPGPGLTVITKAMRVILPGVAVQHGKDLDRLVDVASRHVQITANATRNLRYAAAMMILFTGKPLTEITPAEWASAERARREINVTRGNRGPARQKAKQQGAPIEKNWTGLFEIITLRAAYAACYNAGLMSPDPQPAAGKLPLPPTLSMAKAKPFTIDGCLDANGKEIPPRVRAMIFDVYARESGAFDNSTIKSNIVAFNNYWWHVRRILPDHDTLDIPVEIRDQLLREMRSTDARQRKPGSKRTSVGHALTRIRAMYHLMNETVVREELTEHLPTLGGFPWSRHVVRHINKNERSHREARLTGQVRDQIVHLDRLIEAAEHRLSQADEIAALAKSTAHGETFTHDGVTFRRANPNSRYAALHGSGRPVVNIAPEGTRKYWDVDEFAFRAAQARTLVVVLRESGLRIEEAGYLGLNDLKPLTDGDLTIPTIYVKPSKQDRSRTIGLAVDALNAIHDLVQRAKAIYGEYPAVVRVDEYEHVQPQPEHLVFFVYRNRQFTGASAETLRNWLDAVARHYDENCNDGIPIGRLRPHGMRRMFATDLADRGADVIAIQHTLGHANVATTNTYIKADERAAIAEVARARRREAGGSYADEP